MRIDPNSVTERLTWRAVYRDGTVLDQKREDGSENRYADIRRDALERFELRDGERLVFVLHIDSPRQRLIWRRRVEIQQLGEESRRIIVHLAGWHMRHHGENVQIVNVIFPDGRVETAPGWRDDLGWFDKVVPNTHEGEPADL